MDTLPVTAPAKLTLFLQIIGKRSDGYHLLQSLVAFASIGDRISLSPSEKLELAIEGSFAAGLPKGPDNLLYKSAEALRAHYNIKSGARLALQKEIPIGAGLGGGSADAAAALKVLTKFWRLPEDSVILRSLAEKLGSDVPVCLAGKTSWMEGVGEKITPIAMKISPWIVLVNPRIPLLTNDVFRKFSGSFSLPRAKPASLNSWEALMELLQTTRNDLEPAATSLLPVISEILTILKTLPNCALARMAGSGATCFGLFRNEAEAKTAQGILTKLYPSWWCMAASLLV